MREFRVVYTFRIPCFSFYICVFFFNVSGVTPIAAVYKRFFSLHNQVNNGICTGRIFNISRISRFSRFTWFTRYTISSILTWFTICSRFSRITRNAFTRFTTGTLWARIARFTRISWFTRRTLVTFRRTVGWASTAISDSCITAFITRWSFRSRLSRGTIISRVSRWTIFTILTFWTSLSFISLQKCRT